MPEPPTREDLISGEHFENVLSTSTEQRGRSEYESPDDELAVKQNEQVHQAAYNFLLANSIEPFKRSSDQIFVFLTFIIGTENFFRFPLDCYSFGGVLFFLPYLVCVVLLAFPLMFLESALGQYTSLPPLLMFRRLGPAFTGIGWIMTLLICAKALFFSFRPVRLFYAVQPLLALFDPMMGSFGCSFQDRAGECFDPGLSCSNKSSYQLHGRCFYEPFVDIDLAWNSSVLVVTSAAEPLRRLHSEIYMDDFLLKEGSFPMTLVMASAAFQDAAVALLATYGIRTFVKVSRWLVLAPLVATAFFGIYAMGLIGFQRSWESVRGIMEPDTKELFRFSTFAEAALQVMLSLNLGDGTMITISAMKNFRSNFFKDIFVIILVDTAVSFLSCIFIPPIIAYFAMTLYSSLSISGGCKMVIRRRDFDKLFLENSAKMFGVTAFGQLIHSVLAISNFLVTVGVKYVAYETLVMSIRHFFPQLTRFDHRVSRPFLCSIIFFGSFTYTFFVCSSRKTRMYHLNTKLYIVAPPFIGLLEMIILVYFYKLKRLASNIRTMLGDSSVKLKDSFRRLAGIYWYTTWIVVTPFICLILLINEIRMGASNFAKRWAYTLSLLILTALTFLGFSLEMLKGYNRGWKMSSLFETQAEWGPARHEDRKLARFHEKAAHIV